MAKVKIYEYANCSTCKKALKFLDAQGIEYERMPIVERPPSLAELRKMAGYLDGDFRKLFNTSGELYREMKLSEKMKSMTLSDAIAQLARHGKLIKRPFVLTDHEGLVGFREEEWKRVFGPKR